jgi:hypothetical protein
MSVAPEKTSSMVVSMALGEAVMDFPASWLPLLLWSEQCGKPYITPMKNQ